ncbi:TetR/AcrR family transcriptional regulator [Mycobacterium europaeum]|uniref:TetR/AcrR family transcriptional regulator n=1 Tax=Mycobacterium europaeum TaxID=761804 RepID=UPI002ADF53B8|nr:TetR/AcrR family transcriptional regulator [Mycobacterium europaeum]MEA1162827.1 TetR/AcrR family transcriptional regulator [Mycobacterium europaeum]
MAASPTRGKEARALPRREQILEAARAVIDEHGPDALTEQIAERAGLARPNVYRHFASKEELDLEVARTAYRELQADIVRRLELCNTPLDVIRAPIQSQVFWADSNRNLYRFLVSRGYQPSSQRYKADQADFAAELTAIGARYFPHFADDPDAALAIVVELSGLVDAGILAWLNRRTESRKALVDRLVLHAWLIIDHHLRDRGVRIDPEVPLPRPGKKRNR